MNDPKTVSRRGLFLPALSFLGGALAFVVTFGCGGKKRPAAAEPRPDTTPVEDGPPAANDPPAAAKVGPGKVTKEEYDAEVEELLKHHKVVNEPKSMKRGGGDDNYSQENRCSDHGQGHIDSCDEKLKDCADSVLCRTHVKGGCDTANFCGLSNVGECPTKVVCGGDVSTKP